MHFTSYRPTHRAGGRPTHRAGHAAPRGLLAGVVCTALLWWLPGSPTLGPVAAGTAAPGDGRAAAAAASVADASPAAVAPVVVGRSMTATIGPSDASPPPEHGTTAVSDVALDAYRVAVSLAPQSCHLDVSLLAAIGQVESGNLAGHRLDADHRPVLPVLGPVLNGSEGRAAVSDTDGGEWDHHTRWDRAVGPMQFIPSGWRLAGVDLDADGERNPQDVEDAAGAAMVFLCAGRADLSTASGLRSATFAYNHSRSYVRLVLAWKAAFESQGLDLARAPLSPLSAVQYRQIFRDLAVSTSRTANALGASGSDQGSGQAAGHPGGKGEEAHPSTHAGPSAGPGSPAGGSTSPGATSAPVPSPAPVPSSAPVPSPAGSTVPGLAPTLPQVTPTESSPTGSGDATPVPQPSEEPTPSAGPSSPTEEPECPTPVAPVVGVPVSETPSPSDSPSPTPSLSPTPEDGSCGSPTATPSSTPSPPDPALSLTDPSS